MIAPHAENVLVLFDHHNPSHPSHPSNRKTAGGLFVPESVAAADPVEVVMATVIAAGPGHYDAKERFIPMDPGIVPGARVVIEGKRAAAILSGQPYFIDGIEHRIVREHDIGGVLEEDEAAE